MSKLVDYGRGPQPEMPKQPAVAPNDLAKKSVEDRYKADAAEVNIRQVAADLDKKNGKGGTYLLTARGRRIGPFFAETLAHAIANNPGCREAIPGAEPASLSVGANGEAAPRIRVWEMPHW